MPKPPLPYEELTDVIDLALWSGQLLLQYGAEAARIEETVHHIGTGLGCDWMDILVSPNAILATTISGNQFRTKIRRVARQSVNFAIIDHVNDLSHHVSANQLDRFQLRRELQRITDMPRNYSRWTVVGLVGLACGAFSQLFGADMPVFLMTVLAASIGMAVRQELEKRYFNNVLIVILTAFVVGIVSGTATAFKMGAAPELALASSVLLLVPGVPLINAAEDLIQGHMLSGVARGLTGAVVSLGIAVGLSLAMVLMGIDGL